MTHPHLIEIISAAVFGLAVLHTFATKYFERLAHLNPRHAGVWHLLGEVEIVFGFWALVLMLAFALLSGPAQSIAYLEHQNFTEPLFVFVILVVAGTRPILFIARFLVNQAVRFVPIPEQMAFYLLVLTIVPLLGSFITEPAAMTLAALMLRDRYFVQGVSKHLKYATLAVLLVNVSIGGTLTSYAAPPVLMVAAKWKWDTSFMLAMFGWKSAIAVVINSLTATFLFRQSLRALPTQSVMPSDRHTPMLVVLVHLIFLLAVVFFSHHPVVFMGIFLFFLGYTEAYSRHQDPLYVTRRFIGGIFPRGTCRIGWTAKMVAATLARWHGS